MTDPNISRNTTIRIGGKTYSGFDDMPPEVRQKFEQMVKQMRDSGVLEDKNRDGIPDRFETPLRIAGWIGKLTGNPQIKERFEQQLRALSASAGTTTRMPTPPQTSSGTARAASPTPAEPARIRTTTATNSSQVSARPSVTAHGSRATPRNLPQSVVQRSGHDPREDTGPREFLRKLAIVSAVVIAGYVLLRVMGSG